MGWYLCVGLLYEHRFAVLIMRCLITATNASFFPRLTPKAATVIKLQLRSQKYFLAMITADNVWVEHYDGFCGTEHFGGYWHYMKVVLYRILTALFVISDSFYPLSRHETNWTSKLVLLL